MNRAVQCACMMVFAIGASADVTHGVADERGTIKGKIVFKGDPAKYEPQPLEAVKGTNCDNGTPMMSEEVLLNKATTPTTIRNVVVYLKERPFETPRNLPRTYAVIEARDCRLEPHVVAVRAAQRVDLKNSDDLSHQFRLLSVKNKMHGFVVPRKGLSMAVSFEAEPPFHVTSEFFPWMSAWLAVFDHPYFLVTDTDGAYDFSEFPPGKYLVEAWHEKFGVKSITVELKAGETKQVDIVFEPDAK
ncbi:MAG: carboxypeptidase regulatory-like domain-containing protein [Planctomycetota bacterium]